MKDAAFTLQGNHPVHVRPRGQHSPDLNGISVEWLGTIPSGYTDCSQVPDPVSGSPWQTSPLDDGAVAKCLKITGFAIPKHGEAKVDVNSSSASRAPMGGRRRAKLFRAGFSFRSTTRAVRQ